MVDKEINMTREDKLYSMRMQDLAAVAEKLGIKINTKAAKSQAVEKILAAEEMNKQNEKELAKEEKENAEIMQQQKKDSDESKLVPMPGTTDSDWGEKAAGKKKTLVEELTEVGLIEDVDGSTIPAKPKRGALIEYNGKAQNICAWAKELNKSANTLYSRIYKLGWPVHKAFTK